MPEKTYEKEKVKQNTQGVEEMIKTVHQDISKLVSSKILTV